MATTAPNRRLTVALTQWHPTDNLAANLEVATRLIADAGARHADIVLLPENGLMLGTAEQMRAAALQTNDAVIETLCREAERGQCAVVVGGVKRRDTRGVIRNTALVLGADGVVCGGYDKIHLFDANLDGASFEASRVEEPGQVPVLVRVRDILVGLSICYDLRFPELYRSLALAGAEVLFVPAAFAASTGKAHWESLLRARAIENGAYVVASATVSGSQDDEPFRSYGHAMAVDPWGRVLVDLGQEAPALHVVDIDTDAVSTARSALPVLQQVRPDAYTAKVTTLETK